MGNGRNNNASTASSLASHHPSCLAQQTRVHAYIKTLHLNKQMTCCHRGRCLCSALSAPHCSERHPLAAGSSLEGRQTLPRGWLGQSWNRSAACSHCSLGEGKQPLLLPQRLSSSGGMPQHLRLPPSTTDLLHSPGHTARLLPLHKCAQSRWTATGLRLWDRSWAGAALVCVHTVFTRALGLPRT